MTNSNLFADLVWAEDGQPFSTHFGDVYFSRESGLEETRHVFLASNDLPTRWAALEPQAHFCIAETGFGTGLNFLCAWQLWDRTAPRSAQLHFVSTEKFPLSCTDMRRALELWPELQPWSSALLEQYTDLVPGWQHFSLAEGRVRLTLLVGDLMDTLPQLDASVDAWFLDGFAPAKNPEMWQPALYEQMARLSKTGTTLATFTSVGNVRRGLQDAGFNMQKVKGYGRKRHMLAGVLAHNPSTPWHAPWYARPGASNTSQARQALIIGGGLAGCSTAFALARRGWQVTLIERHACVAQEASGNPQGILYCKLSPHQPPLSRFVQTCYSYALRMLHQQLPQSEDNWAACGVLQLADASSAEAKRQQALAAQGYPPGFLRYMDQVTASETAGFPLPSGGLWFPEAGWVNPPALCQALIQHPGIRLLSNSNTCRLQYHNGQWSALDAAEQAIAQAPVAIICAAADSRQLHQSAHLPLKAIRGQITHLPATPDSAQLKAVLCAEGYISPARHAEHHVGASFRFDRHDHEPSVEENISNLALLESLSPTLGEALEVNQLAPEHLKARAALRCTTPDYLPLIGPLAAAEPFNDRYQVLGKDASKRPEQPAPWYPGLYVNTAHGSRGLISCPLSGELVAAWIEGSPLPLPRVLAEAVHPNRFLLRQLIRGQAQKP